MFVPFDDNDSRKLSLMNPANMRELFIIGEKTSCPMKDCSVNEKPVSAEER
jgi:hypothetical protein